MLPVLLATADGARDCYVQESAHRLLQRFASTARFVLFPNHLVLSFSLYSIREIVLRLHRTVASAHKTSQALSRFSVGSANSDTLNAFEAESTTECVKRLLHTSMHEVNAIDGAHVAVRLVAAMAYKLQQRCVDLQSVSDEVAQSVLNRVNQLPLELERESPEFRESLQRSRLALVVFLSSLDLPPLPTEHLLRDLRVACQTDDELKRVLEANSWSDLVSNDSLPPNYNPHQEISMAFDVLHRNITQWLDKEKQRLLSKWHSNLESSLAGAKPFVEKGDFI